MRNGDDDEDENEDYHPDGSLNPKLYTLNPTL